METVSETLRKTPLFAGISNDDLVHLIPCLKVREQTFLKGNCVLMTGDPVDAIGIVMDGHVKLFQEEIDGRESLLFELAPPELLGEVFACAGVSQSPVTVVASTAARVLFLPYQNLIATCSDACPYHRQLISNLLTLVAQKTLLLNQKLQVLSKRTIRERVLTFLRQQGQLGSPILIPYNRQELAAYLCVDRSALSMELSKLQTEGLLQCQKNRFTLLHEPFPISTPSPPSL